ncbi:Uncharacterised protein [Klebsiella pneumoniae]|nr:Uncharacterised protein [Klebsiella pneumoniae]
MQVVKFKLCCLFNSPFLYNYIAKWLVAVSSTYHFCRGMFIA